MLTTKVKLGIGTLFACLSVLLLLLVAPKASAVYQDGDYSPYTPQELFNRADQIYYEAEGLHLNPNSYYIVKDETWSNNRVNYSIYSFQDDITSISFPSNIPTSNDSTLYSTNNYKFAQVQTTIYGVNEQPPINQVGYSSIRYFSSPANTVGMKKWRLDYYYSPNVTLVFNNGNINPTVSYDAGYYIGSSAFNLVFGVTATENSIYNGWWVETKPYKVNVQLTYNNQPLVYTVPNYTSYYMDLRTAPILWPRPIMHQINPYWSFTNTLHQIKYMPTNYDGFFDSQHTLSPTSLTSPIIEYSSDWVDPNYEDENNYNINGLQTVSLSSLMKYIQEDYPNFVFTDFQQDITVTIVGAEDNHTYYSNILRYSQVEFPEDAPPSDPDVPDWFQDLSDMINQYNAEKTFNYLFNLPNSYSPIAKVGSLGALTSIDEPNFEFQPIEDLDNDAVGFFSWLVNLIVNSPVGVLMLFALTFLVVSAVIK